MPAAATLPATKQTYKWEVLWVVMVGTLMAALDQSIVNVSLHDIMADFGSSVDDIEWVVTGYMLSFAVLLPVTAWLRHRVGYKKLYLGSLVIFTLGSLFCAMAWNLPSLVFARVIQALGGGAITPTAMAMITEVFEPKERAKAIGYWGVGVIVGPSFGPTLGGYLTHELGWRSIFTINLPIGIIGILMAIFMLKNDNPKEGQKPVFDFWGFLFLSAFMIGILLGLTEGEEKGWTSPFIITCWITAVVGFIGFFVVEILTPDDGIIDIRLFKIPIYSACMMVVCARSLALFGGVFLLPLFLQDIMGFDEIQAGLILLPGSLLIAFMMPVAAKLSDYMGPLWPSLGGLAGVAYFMYEYRTLDVNTSLWGVIDPTLLRGVAIAFLIAPVMATAMNVIPKEKTSMSSSLLNLIQQVAGSIGIALLGAILSHRTVFHMGVIGASVKSSSAAVMDSYSQLAERAHELGLNHAQASQAAQGALAGHLAKMASEAAYQDAFLAGAVIVFLSMIPALLLPAKNVQAQGSVKKEAVVLE
jgi:DHA2 family multidrug resistance protein